MPALDLGARFLRALIFWRQGDSGFASQPGDWALAVRQRVRAFTGRVKIFLTETDNKQRDEGPWPQRIS